LRDANPFKQLDWLFRNTTKSLKNWSDRFIGSIRLQLEITKEVVAKLEVARDSRQLAPHEESLRCELKLKSLGLSSLQRIIARQESRVLWLSEGDAPIKFFHVQANARHRRKFIRSLEHDGQILVSEDHKVATVFDYFDSIMGTPPAHDCSIAFVHMDLPQL
jgi:hypothetical protein